MTANPYVSSEMRALWDYAAHAVRSVGMDIEDGLALTFSCTDYPDWIREMNGWPIEDAAKEIARHAGER